MDKYESVMIGTGAIESRVKPALEFAEFGMPAEESITSRECGRLSLSFYYEQMGHRKITIDA